MPRIQENILIILFGISVLLLFFVSYVGCHEYHVQRTAYRNMEGVWRNSCLTGECFTNKTFAEEPPLAGQLANCPLFWISIVWAIVVVFAIKKVVLRRR